MQFMVFFTTLLTTNNKKTLQQGWNGNNFWDRDQIVFIDTIIGNIAISHFLWECFTGKQFYALTIHEIALGQWNENIVEL
jgi:hypothetical protein